MLILPDLSFKERIFCTEIQSNKEQISGIYRIYDKDSKCVYVGKSKDIFGRIRTHLKKHDKKDYMFAHNYISFDYALLNDEADKDIYETYYINLIKPMCNTQKVFFPIDEIERQKYYSNEYLNDLEKETEDFYNNMEQFFLLY